MKLNGRMPILEIVKDYGESDILPLHMPGHKRGTVFERAEIEIPWKDALKFDTTEVGDIDNLHYPEGAIREAEELAAKTFGAEKTFFLANGTTAGILAMINTVAREGDSIIVPRNCHKSVFNALVIGKIKPIYLVPDIDLDFGIAREIKHEVVAEAFDKNPEAVAVLITNPTFYGTCSDLEKIAFEAHNRGKLLIVDEAHGAHFHFSDKLPKSALESGADIVAQSTHKCLCSMTGSSMLHVRNIEKIDMERLRFYLQAYQTSSPNHLLLASLDASRELISTDKGLEMLDLAIESGKRLKAKLRKLKGIMILEEKFGSYYEDILTPKSEINGYNEIRSVDPLRLTINFRHYGIYGTEIERILRENYRIQVELSDILNIVAIFTLADSEEVFERVYMALLRISEMINISEQTDISELTNIQNSSNIKCILQTKDNFFIPIDLITSNIPIKLNCVKVIEPWIALDAKKENIIIEEAIGLISGEMLIPYPPGIPLIMPGEMISQELVEHVRTCMNHNIRINRSIGNRTGYITVIKN